MSARLSPDGLYYWDGAAWVSTLSPDGRHRWDGAAWVPVASPVYAPPAKVLREPTRWTRPLQAALGVWFGLAAIFSLTLPVWMGGMMSEVFNQSIQRQQQLNPQATPLPAGFADSMTSMMTSVAWVAAVFGFALYGGAVIGALMRWTWLYYVALGLFGLSLLGLPFNIVNLTIGQSATGVQTLVMPGWFLAVAIVSGLVQGGLFVCMLIALVRIGPWAMRRVA